MTIFSGFNMLSIERVKRGMRRGARLLLAVPLTLTLATFSFAASSASDNFDASRIVEKINWEIRNTQGDDTGRPRLLIEEVDLELTVVSEAGAAGSLRISVPTMPIVDGNIVAAASQSLHHKIHFTFAPPRRVTVSPGEQLELVKAIWSLKAVLRDAINEPPQVELKSFEFEVTFAVAREENGRLRLWVFETS
jgi:hypothetical protein